MIIVEGINPDMCEEDYSRKFQVAPLTPTYSNAGLDTGSLLLQSHR